jgi:hypothetical protein
MGLKASAKETSRRKKLSEKIEHLGPIEHGEIFRKLKTRNLGYTQNSNGIFFDITNVPDDVVDDLVAFVDHCIENQKMLKTSRQNQILRSLDEKRPGHNNTGPAPPGGPVEEGADGEEARAEGGGAGENSGPARAGPAAAVPRGGGPDQIPPKKSGSKFQNTRKKYSRPVAAKVNYVNELRRE